MALSFTRKVNMSPGQRDTGDVIDAGDVNDLQEALEDISLGTVPIPLAGIEGALGEWVPTTGAVAHMRSGVANVLDYGAVGNGSTDDTASIQAAIDSGASTVIFPVPPDRYNISDSLVPKKNQRLLGLSGMQYPHYAERRVLIGPSVGMTVPMIDVSAGAVTVESLSFLGRGGTTGTIAEVGVGNSSAADFVGIDRCHFYRFGGPAIKCISGMAWRVLNVMTTNCVMDHAGLTDYVGALDLHGTDHYVTNCEFGCSSAGITTGYRSAGVIRSAANFIIGNIFEISERGLVIDNTSSSAFRNIIIGNRADLNYGHGFVVEGYGNQLIGNLSLRNGRGAHNTYDGFSVTGRYNQFIGNSAVCYAEDAALAMRYGYRDASTPGSDAEANIYLGNRGNGLATGVYNVTDADNQVIDFATRTANADTSGATLGQLETEVNELKALLRAQGLMRA